MEQVRHLGFVLKDVYRLWVRLFEQRLPQLGMTFTQCKVLVFLSRNEGTTQAKLAETSDTEPMTLVRVLDRMERDGWIERRPDPAVHPALRRLESVPAKSSMCRFSAPPHRSRVAPRPSDPARQAVEAADQRLL